MNFNRPTNGLTSKVLFLSLIILLIAAGCSGTSDDDKAQRPTRLVVYSTVDAVHDPLLALTSEQQFLMSLENRTLFSLSTSGDITANLAQSHSVSDDGKKITVQLAENTFTDGTDITSSDVKATLARVASAGGELADLVENVKGSGEAKSGADFFGITTPDEREVEFELVNPDPFFVYHLAHPATSIVPSRLIDSQGTLSFGAHSGEYTAEVISNDIDTSTTYVPRSKDMPTIEVVRKSTSSISEASKEENVDIILGSSGSDDDFEEVSVQQLAVASWNLYVADANSALGNVRFRQAILIALDQEESIAAYGTRAVIPTRFTSDTFDSVACESQCETNKKKAQQLVKSAFPDANVPTITIDIENNSIQKELAQSAKKKLSAVGIPTTIRENDATGLSDAIARGEVQLFRFGWLSDIAVGADSLVKNYKADSTENVSGVTDASLEKNITSYLDATTFNERKEASIDLQERLKDLWITRPIAQFHKIVTVNKRISGVTFDFYGRARIENIRES
jgi:ABC-type transport system substrate-binding protein